MYVYKGMYVYGSAQEAAASTVLMAWLRARSDHYPRSRWVRVQLSVPITAVPRVKPGPQLSARVNADTVSPMRQDVFPPAKELQS
jgi:hypothetical protein